MASLPRPSGLLWLQWLSYLGAVLAFLVILVEAGAMAWVIDHDPSHLSLVLLALLFLGLGRGFWVCGRLNKEIEGHGTGVTDYRAQSEIGDAAVQILTERIRGPQELGWFLAGLGTKLGLLGTVIGFMIMMGSVADVESFDFEAAQDLIRRMTEGIGVALVTTLVGLSVSMVLSIQSFLFERAGERLIADVVEQAGG